MTKRQSFTLSDKDVNRKWDNEFAKEKRFIHVGQDAICVRCGYRRVFVGGKRGCIRHFITIPDSEILTDGISNDFSSMRNQIIASKIENHVTVQTNEGQIHNIAASFACAFNFSRSGVSLRSATIVKEMFKIKCPNEKIPMSSTHLSKRIRQLCQFQQDN